ncbi:YybH family protein [Microvirga sp. 2TAF3]|uniref:YybH family protein n=1 Tax=Microvirga sp. 2TAF3 TaxID=3233014 RepID=UPI003F99003A
MRPLRKTAIATGVCLLSAFNAMAEEKMSAQQLIDADKAFNEMAQQDGMGKAFIAYSAENPTMIRPGNMPLLGKSELVDAFSKVPGSPLSWEPLKAEIAQSQDLGYTFGRYKVRDGGEIKSHGVYVTIWKKQPDGSWKFVLDGGGTTPQEVQKP